MASLQRNRVGGETLERKWAILSLVGLVGLSIAKGYLGIDEASTVLISASSGAIIGFYFGARAEPPAPEA